MSPWGRVFKCAWPTAFVSLGEQRTESRSGSRAGLPPPESAVWASELLLGGAPEMGLRVTARFAPGSWGGTGGSGVPAGVWIGGWLGWGQPCATRCFHPGAEVLCSSPAVCAIRLTELKTNKKRNYSNKFTASPREPLRCSLVLAFTFAVTQGKPCRV